MTAKARMILIGVIVPLLIAAAGVIAVLVALPQLPNPIATHWGPSGQPDGFGTPLLAILLPALTVLAFSGFALYVSRSGPVASSVNQRIILAVNPTFAVLITALVVGSTVMQMGLSDARDAGSILPLLLVALVASIAVGVGAWFLLPESTGADAHEAEPQTLPLGEGERATWMQRAEPSRGLAVVVTGILVLSVVAGGLGLLLSAPPAAVVVIVIVLMLVSVLALGMLSWRVSIDRRGLRVRSVIGFPRFVVALSEVESASVIDVVPARDFGGWGLRWGGGRRWGIVTRRGEALEVKRRDGSALVVTVPSAATGAALLNTLAQRVH